jgi:NAD(P)-dependent dehydrogenase (short-subunit alcohol dehydrogenase family)
VVLKNIVITGGNRGIGLALVRLFAKTAHVTALCRKSSEELDEIKNVNVITDVDLKSWVVVDEAVSQCPQKIDTVILNAGIYENGGSTLGTIVAKSLQEQFLVNAVAPLMLVQSLMPRLKAGSKVALITSRMASMEDNSSGGAYGYRMSKAAMNAMGVSLARDLKERGVAVMMLHPGFVRTDMTGYSGQLTPQESAELLAKRIEQLTLEQSGQFRHARGEILPW